MKLLFVVEQAVAVAGKGLVLLPGVPQDASLAGATSVELRLPNGTSVAARVAGMAHFGRKPGAPTPHGWRSAAVAPLESPTKFSSTRC